MQLGLCFRRWGDPIPNCYYTRDIGCQSSSGSHTVQVSSYSSITNDLHRNIFTIRMPWSGKLPLLNLFVGPKTAFFTPQWLLVAPIHTKFGTTKGHVGPLGHTKFHANWFTGVGMQPPKWQTFPLFGKESQQRGELLFLQLLGASNYKENPFSSDQSDSNVLVVSRP